LLPWSKIKLHYLPFTVNGIWECLLSPLGMVTWNPDLAKDNPWSKAISSEYTSKLETAENQAPAAGEYPELGTGKNTGEEILNARITKLFADGLSDVFVSAEEVFAAPDSFFIINYERKDKYDSGHIPGAIRYKPGGTLGIPKKCLQSHQIKMLWFIAEPVIIPPSQLLT